MQCNCPTCFEIGSLSEYGFYNCKNGHSFTLHEQCGRITLLLRDGKLCQYCPNGGHKQVTIPKYSVTCPVCKNKTIVTKSKLTSLKTYNYTCHNGHPFIICDRCNCVQPLYLDGGHCQRCPKITPYEQYRNSIL